MGGPRYPYRTDLLALDACRPLYPVLSETLRKVVTPLDVRAWVRALAGHTDEDFRSYIISGLTLGFRVGFSRSHQLRPAFRNMPSADEHPEVVEDYISKERKAGRLIGPLTNSDIHINRVGVIPKGHTPGRWRLITDLSHPQEWSVNDGIDPALCSLSYVTVDMVARTVEELGAGALMAKVDIESAYRLVPVHPDDRPLLGLRWRGDLYCDAMLPFGLRSAPKIFTAVADALEWCIRQRGVEWIRHYLDDYITLGPPASDRCQCNLRILEEVCAMLGVPLAAHKREGPTTCLTFLGIEIDSVASSLRLPEEKLQRLLRELHQWGDKKACTRRELESLVGLLNHACKVVRPGRTFLRRMIDLLTVTGSNTACRPHHHIRLNREFRADLAWWQLFLRSWNGVGLLGDYRLRHGHELTSDASGTWGCGAWYGTSWFQYPWSGRAQHLSIAVKELFPIVIAAAVWGHRWKGLSITSYCDNTAVVAVLNSRSCRDKHLMHLLRCLFFYEAYWQFNIRCHHVAGRCNDKADDLSRNDLPAFLSKVPGADAHPPSIPEALPRLLLSQELDWISPTWIQLFKHTLNKV